NDIMVDERITDKAFEIEKLRRLMIYRNQDLVIPPPMPMGHGESMAEGAQARSPEEACRPAMRMSTHGGDR
ncbi:MAG: hypothetical protein V3S60_00375, partial [Acidimicrobiia bacterium]